MGVRIRREIGRLLFFYKNPIEIFVCTVIMVVRNICDAFYSVISKDLLLDIFKETQSYSFIFQNPLF